MHPLDNPVWHALTGPQATLAQGRGDALRYDPDVAPFSAMPDVARARAWVALGTLVGAGGGAVLFRDVEPPSGWEVLARMPTHQMVAPTEELAPAPTGVTPLELRRADVPEMLTLVERTRPGPFGARTIELGTYLGVRAGGALVAMAGERMRLPGYTEISGVCTGPEHRGRGHAAALVTGLVHRIRARGEVPVLHVLVDNTSAIALYERLGFTVRTTYAVVVVRAPTCH